MKYSESLPKINFQSTIGDFSISDFFSFYEYDPDKLNKSTTTVDNRNTLTELSYKIYKDNNSMWLFLIANNITDPFELLSQNSTIQVNKVKDNINLGLYYYTSPGATAVYLNAAGSILTEYTGTSGQPWEYSYVGNFDLDGPFGLIDSTDYYSGKMVLTGQTGDTNPFITPDPETEQSVIAIENFESGYISGNTQYNTFNKKEQLQDPINISIAKSKVIDPGTSNYPAVSAFAPTSPTIPSYGNDGATAIITDYERIIGKNKSIEVIPPLFVSTIFNNLKKMSFN